VNTWLDKHYRMLMLVLMIIELLELSYIAAKAH
jgi:hypothetical protein